MLRSVGAAVERARLGPLSQALPALADALPGLVDAVSAGRMSAPARRAGRASDVDKPLPHTLAEDAADIRRSLSGDHDAYARIVRRYQDQLAGQIWRASRQRADYEELLQEVFIEAYQSLPKYRGEAPVLAWLRRIATRVCYRYWKRLGANSSQQTFTDLQWADVAAGASDGQQQVDSVETVHRLLAQLSPRDRLVVTLIYLEGRSVAETAELSGWSQTMVKVQAFRARKKLQKLLGH